MKKLTRQFYLTAFLFILFSCSENEFQGFGKTSDYDLKETIKDYPLFKDGPILNIDEENFDCSITDESDVYCRDIPEIIEDYVSHCISLPRSFYPPNSTATFDYSLTYYVDGDIDVNLNNYISEINNQVLNLQTFFSQTPIHSLSAEVIDWPCYTRQNNTATIRYFVEYTAVIK